MNKLPGKTIQFQLTAAFTAIFALTFLLIGIVVLFALNRSIDQTADHELHSRLAEIRKYFDSFSPNDLTHLEEEFKEEALLSQASANTRIFDPTGKLLFQTPATDRWPTGISALSGVGPRGTIRTIRVHYRSIRVLTAPVRVGFVEIGLPIDEFEEVRTSFLWLIGLGSPLLLLAAALAGFWMSGRALKPVDEISRLASQISAEKLSARLPVNGTGDELDRLSGVLNRMLERLESGFHRITQFTADASHELRTPAAIIQTTAELMQSKPRTVEEHLHAWRRVSLQTESTAHLIADLLTLARADAGKTGLEFQQVDVSAIVKQSASDMETLSSAKGLRLEVGATETPCWTNGDASSLRRLICILLDNAIKFSTAPSVIQLQLHCGEQIEVVVSDAGIGISQSDLPAVFERFYRVSKDRSRESGGTGLGLAIAQRIAEQHAGRIDVSSSLGQGSVLTITLPRDTRNALK